MRSVAIHKDCNKLFMFFAFAAASFLLPAAFLLLCRALGMPLTYQPNMVGGWITHPNAGYVALGIGAMALLTGTVVWAVFKTRLGVVVELDSNGIVFYGDFGNQRIAWDAVTNVTISGDQVVIGNRGGNGLTISAHMLEKSVDQLAAMVESFRSAGHGSRGRAPALGGRTGFGLR